MIRSRIGKEALLGDARGRISHRLLAYTADFAARVSGSPRGALLIRDGRTTWRRDREP
jgi:hypothetical protein